MSDKLKIKVLFIVALTLFAGHLGWGSREAHSAIKDQMQAEFREKTAIKCLNSKLPFDLCPILKEAEEEDDIPMSHLLALFEVESGGNPRKISSDKVHVGIGQVWLGHCKALKIAENDLFDPRVNARATIWVLKQKKVTHKNILFHYISGYNTKDNIIRNHVRHGKSLPGETKQHWKRWQFWQRKYQRFLDHGIWVEAEVM